MNNESDLLEARMRAALHLRRPASSATSPRPPRPIPAGRHRFVQDGEVPPVVVVNPRQQRPEAEQAAVSALENSLARERVARLAAEAALAQATTTIRQLQTRLAHAEMAQREAAPAPATPKPEVEQASAPKRARARPRGPAKAGSQAKDKPIKWWKPGWKERFRDGQA